jgi:amino-acid N-acetyltransferase
MLEALVIHGRPTRSIAVALLADANLPVSDLTNRHLEHFFFTGSAESPTGLVGLEIFGSDALLRSLVVSAGARAAGLGSWLVRHAEDYASARHVRAIYLRLGYRRIDRSQAPPSIRSSREFASLCPASSALMMRQL